MKVVKFSPITPGSLFDTPSFPDRFSNILDQFFDEAVSQKSDGKGFSPKLNISEDENGYQLELALPGIKKEDISINLKDNTLTISGERKFRDDKKERKYHRIESGYGKFSRELSLNDEIDKTNIDANYTDGILTIYLKKKEQQASKQIEIK